MTTGAELDAAQTPPVAPPPRRPGRPRRRRRWLIVVIVFVLLMLPVVIGGIWFWYQTDPPGEPWCTCAGRGAAGLGRVAGRR